MGHNVEDWAGHVIVCGLDGDFRPRRIDYKMPEINGIELAGRLRQSDADTPVILITGYPDGNISARAAAAGVKDVILKPLLDENLVKRIRDAIQNRRGN